VARQLKRNAGSRERCTDGFYGARLVFQPRMKQNTVSHFEIYANDPDALAKFYTQLFDWDVQHMPHMDYRLVKTVDTGADNRPETAGAINGGIATRPHGYGVNGSVNYVMVDSVETYVDKAQKLGARLTKGKTAAPGMGWFAMFMDPEGNHFAVFKAEQSAK
jgi:predicted enzyme related to lactoylglutathione lyase